MNQILQTTDNSKSHKILKYRIILKSQLFLSIFLIILTTFILFYTNFKRNEKEKYSNQILNNYNISKIYSNISLSTSNNTPYIIGVIEIPKINVYYPIFSNYDDELLKISPCRFYGPSPGKIGNLCIAGHNYDNDKFFSKISSLKTDDEIIIYSNSNKKIIYLVFDTYEVDSNDLSPIYSYNENLCLLTLITCNNKNNNRIIVRAKK